MKWKHLPIVAFDTETTGLQPFGGDRIIEFAAVVLHLGPDGQVAQREDHSWLVNPGIPIPKKATEITGITDADVLAAPPFSEIAHRVRELFVDRVTVAHNYPFDRAFLTKAFADCGEDWHEPLAEIDTVDLSMRMFPEARRHNLAEVSKRLDVVLEGAHRATNDAAACGLCFTTLARRRDVEDDLQAMLDWAGAIGRPPQSGPFDTDATGRVLFAEGEFRGHPVADHPVHLAWMEKARVRQHGRWDWRFAESSRRWIRSWLEVRGAGRATVHPKGFRSEDWMIYPCIAVQQERT